MAGDGGSGGHLRAEQVRAPAQYGPRLRAYVLYLAVYQHVPYDRIRRLLADRYGALVMVDDSHATGFVG